MEGDQQSNGNRPVVELQVTGDDLNAVIRIKMNQISQLELQVMALTRLLAERDNRISSLENDIKSDTKSAVEV
jgi:hypothetical protein